MPKRANKGKFWNKVFKPSCFGGEAKEVGCALACPYGLGKECLVHRLEEIEKLTGKILKTKNQVKEGN